MKFKVGDMIDYAYGAGRLVRGKVIEVHENPIPAYGVKITEPDWDMIFTPGDVIDVPESWLCPAAEPGSYFDRVSRRTA